MLKEKETVVRRFLIFVDTCVLVLAYLSAYLLNRLIGDSSIPLLRFWLALVFAVPYWCLALYANGMYQSMRTRTYLEILWAVVKAAALTFLLMGTFIFLLKLTFMSRLFFILFMGFSFLFIWLEKTAIFMSSHYVRRQGLNTRRLLIVGTGNRAREFIKKVDQHPEWGFELLGAIDDEPGRGVHRVGRLDVIGVLDDIPGIFHRDAVDEVIFVVPRSRLNALQGAIDDCETEGVVVTIAVDLFDTKLARASVAELDGQPLLHFKTTHAKEWELLVKRIFDFASSGLGIVALLPLFLLMSVLIKVTSKGPVFFKQNRLGLAGRRFTLYKFRTMKQGAQAVLSDVADLQAMTTPEFREKKTQWITPIGRFMRKFSIDELPQLFNVFIGHMSIVGPRPTVPDEVEKYKDWQRRRFSMKPGITCLWQVNGRNNIAFEDWMKLDLEYLDNWSLWLDAKILMKTVPVVLFGIGAY
ncbi:MAG TPA: sugar transferase [Candidatus Aminicenantes bacterium]|nr:sugar transferase [Candidatus Aminicenantes bacterium]HRY64868.1 sugar transferase [Candidatus Aminicenantes bacterium]HRZ71781.1 sugar transferase [Candidatus Aminicenantes bacterium]